MKEQCGQRDSSPSNSPSQAGQYSNISLSTSSSDSLVSHTARPRITINITTPNPINVIVPDFDCSEESSVEENAVENCLVYVEVTFVGSDGLSWIDDNGAIAVNSHSRFTVWPIVETFTSVVEINSFLPFKQSKLISPSA